MSDGKPKNSLVRDPDEAWKPYHPTSGMPWDAARVAHLHRRAGLGATWGQLERDVREGFEPSIGRILAGEPTGPGRQTASEFADIVTVMEESARRRPSIERVQMLWLYRLIFTPFPLSEVMTLAWHSHYATSEAKVNSPELMLAQNDAQRELWRAPMSKLQRRMLSDAAMRRWLDGLNSAKAQPNENLGREFLELFALGEGHYTERDVREVARALTGWIEVDSQQHRVQFAPTDHDSGTKTILGETGNWGLDDVVRIACRQRAAAVHIARRLYRTFISDTDLPFSELLAPLADAMRINGDVDVGKGIEIVLRSQLFHSAECRERKVKSPVELAIGVVRACELFAPPPPLIDLEIHLTNMGQRLFYPPSVAGWPGGLTSLDGQAIVARANFAAWITEPELYDDGHHHESVAKRHGLTTSSAWRDAMMALLCGVPPAKEARDRIDRLSHDRFQSVRHLLSLPEAQLA